MPSRTFVNTNWIPVRVLALRSQPRIAIVPNNLEGIYNRHKGGTVIRFDGCLKAALTSDSAASCGNQDEVLGAVSVRCLEDSEEKLAGVLFGSICLFL